MNKTHFKRLKEVHLSAKLSFERSFVYIQYTLMIWPKSQKAWASTSFLVIVQMCIRVFPSLPAAMQAKFNNLARVHWEGRFFVVNDGLG